MAVREVLRMPHPILKQRCAAIDDDDAIERIARDLLDTMDASPRCVGIAAPQIGEAVRMCAIDVSGHPKARSCAGRVVLVDPVVVEQEGAKLGREGCLSVPQFTGDVRRATRVVVQDGRGTRMEADAFEARCLLHELDHLDGILFLDRVVSASAVFRRRDYG
ncbi:MAG: peptide deformylase [Solirubrobacteraceae bacterium]